MELSGEVIGVDDFSEFSKNRFQLIHRCESI